jgi:hypothetical protein
MSQLPAWVFSITRSPNGMPKAAATNDRLLAMVAAQKPDSGKSKWVVESQARDGAKAFRGGL